MAACLVSLVKTSTDGQRTAGAPRTKILEDRLRRAKALLYKIQAQNPSAQHNVEISSIFESPPGSPSSVSDTPGLADDNPGDHLENMLDGRGRLTANKKSTEYYGGGSGFAFLQRTQELFNPEAALHGHPRTGNIGSDVISRLFDSPLPDKQALATDVPFSQLLPSRQTATGLLNIVFGQTYHLLHFLHEPAFQKQTERIYDLDPIEFSDSDHDFLPLFYAVTALGYLFNGQLHRSYGCKGAVNQA
ncbi:Gypsy retrotransposon integrase-like protein 1 [Knufia peltigerae]|nr:Gypsy retrotransposon integrase-like protein 1 [Knufia peltigerae]